MELRQAHKKQAKIKLVLQGPSGSGENHVRTIDGILEYKKKGKLSSSLCRWCHLAPKFRGNQGTHGFSVREAEQQIFI